jgi:hypothetical protein
MTKSEARNAPNADDSFWKKDTELVVREEPEKNRVYDLEVKAQHASSEWKPGSSFDFLKNLERSEE